eukprot:4461435-Prymnesium_polylepis.1
MQLDHPIEALQLIVAHHTRLRRDALCGGRGGGDASAHKVVRCTPHRLAGPAVCVCGVVVARLGLR